MAESAIGRRPGGGLWPVAATVLWAFAMQASSADSALPAPERRAVDRAEVLSAATESALDALLAELESDSGVQVAVLTIPSLAGEPIESYSLRVAEGWGLGSKERDDGVLLLVAVEDRRARIEVGYGLEGTLPDVVVGRIIRESMVPHFRRRDYEAGVLAGARAIADRLRTPAPEAAPAGSASTAVRPPAAAFEVNWSQFWAWIVLLVLMPALGLAPGLVAEEDETRGIVFGALLLPLMLGGSLAVDELGWFPPESGKFLLGGVALLAVCSTLFWWAHRRLSGRPGSRARWRDRLHGLADGRAAFAALAKLGLPISDEWQRAAHWPRGILVAGFHLVLGGLIFRFWSVGYAIFYVHNLLWLFVICRAAFHPSPDSEGGGWSGRSARRSTPRASSWSPASRSRGPSSGGGGSGFRPGGGSFGGGGASGSW